MIAKLIIGWAQRRRPDFVIGGIDNPYLLRWWLLPRNPLFNVYVHRFLRSDDDRALHDHPWFFNCSILLDGRYIEWVPSKTGNPLVPEPKFRTPGAYFRWGRAPHRIQLYADDRGEKPVWTIFITGPRVRAWGFYCLKGWVHWRDFTSPTDKGVAGRGCDQ